MTQAPKKSFFYGEARKFFSLRPIAPDKERKQLVVVGPVIAPAAAEETLSAVFGLNFMLFAIPGTH